MNAEIYRERRSDKVTKREHDKAKTKLMHQRANMVTK